MKKHIQLFASLCFAMSLALAPQVNAAAAEPAAATETQLVTTLPAGTTCAVLPFADHTRYQHVDNAGRLAKIANALLLESQYAVKVIDDFPEDTQSLLYDHQHEELQAAAMAMDTGDATALFESDAYQGHPAPTIDQAQVGQQVHPEFFAQLGKETGAEYFITGEFLGFGTKTHRSVVPYLYYSKSRIIDVNVAFKVVRASDGMVVWASTETGSSKKKATMITFAGSLDTTVSEQMYMTALANATQAFIDDLSGAAAQKKK